MDTLTTVPLFTVQAKRAWLDELGRIALQLGTPAPERAGAQEDERMAFRLAVQATGSRGADLQTLFDVAEGLGAHVDREQSASRFDLLGVIADAYLAWYR